MKTNVSKYKTIINELFDYFHSHPEISWKEHGTTEYIKNILEAHHCKITTFDNITGIVGEIGSGKPTIAVRADMDALWQEVDGQFCANHSCGHDAHMTMVLGALMVLKELNNLPAGTIKFIFQPAEEKGNGALTLVDKGIVDDVDYLYGVHLRPQQELKNNQAAASIQHGAACLLKGEIIGEDAHGARPHLGTNAIEVGATLVELLNKIHIDPMAPSSIKMTKFVADAGSTNIIPGKASFSLDIRAQTNELMSQLITRAYQAVDTASNFHNVKIELEKIGEIPAAEIDNEAKAIMNEAIAEVLGQEKAIDTLVTSGGEDFHFYTIKRPKIKATMLGLGCDLTPGLHHPKMSFDKNALITGTEILVHLILKTLQNEKRVDNHG